MKGNGGIRCLSIPFALSIGSPALALQSCNLVNHFTDAVQTYNVHTRDSIKNDSTFSVP